MSPYKLKEVYTTMSGTSLHCSRWSSST